MSKKKKNKRKYSSGADRTRQSAAQAGPNSGGALFKLPDGMERYKPEEGKVILRFLPYLVTDPKHPDGDAAPEGDIWYKRPWKRIRSIGVENNSFVSPRSFGRPCPISEYFTTAKADPSIPEKEVNKLKTQDCVMYNVQEIDRKGNASDVMFFSFSYHNFEKQLKKELMDPDNEEFAAFMDLEGGYDVRIRWEEDSFGGHKFMYADKISFVERDEDLDEDILDDVVNLDECLIEKSYKELNNIFLEVDEDEEEDDEGSSKKKKGKGKKPKKKEKEGPELDLDDLVDMSKSKMKKFIKKHDLDVDMDQDEEEIRMDLAKELDLDLPEPDKDEDLECPHGLEFGDDFDDKKKCKKCKLRDECEEAYDKANGNGGDDEDDNPECPNGFDFGDDFGTNKKKCKKCKLAEECEEAQEPEEPKKKKKGKKGKKGGDDECPHGHEWAVDCDEEKDCETCDKWDDCVEAQEALKKK